MNLNHQDLHDQQLYRHYEFLKEAEHDRLVKQLSKQQSSLRQYLGRLLVNLGQRLQDEPATSWA